MKSFDEVMALTRTVSGNAAFEEEECLAYYDLLASLPDGATVLEIGLQFGRSSSIVAQLQQDKRLHYIGIDPFVDPPDAKEAWCKLMIQIGASYSLFAVRSDEVTVLPPLDLALIDGDHNADAVANDCRLVLPKIKVGGYALMHDYGRESLPNVYPTVNAAMVAAQMNAEWCELPTVGTLGIWRKGC